jgi:DMSO/TMAO reductase YedYZ heme-binding membrane subunit
VSVRYVPVQWTAAKWGYDAALVAAVVVYVWAFLRLGAPAAEATRPVDGAVLQMRAFGSCAFLMLSLVLAIGPLARLDPRFLPLLYNRRHFGVLTALVALTHATAVLDWYFAFSPTPPLEALLTSNVAYDRALGFPFEALGIFALIVLGVLAATSHDFWLGFLTPPMWKALHLMIYPAYAAVVGHVALGYLQDVDNPAFALVFGGAALGVAGLHLAAWRRGPARPPRGGTGSRSGAGTRSRTAARWWRRWAAARRRRCSATGARCRRSRTPAPTRTGRWARAASSTAASPVPGTASSTGPRTAARRPPTPSGSPPTGCGWRGRWC